MNKEEYGNEFQGHLLEQYKLYIELTDRVSNRRMQANHFYISILTGLLVFISFFKEKNLLVFNSFDVILFSFGILGIFLCFLWNININSYKQLNKLKFIIIHDMENMLPFPCYKREWDKVSDTNYIRLTMIEKYVPKIMMIPYFLIIFYTIYNPLFG